MFLLKDVLTKSVDSNIGNTDDTTQSSILLEKFNALSQMKEFTTTVVFQQVMRILL